MAKAASSDKDLISLMATELRLGLPGTHSDLQAPPPPPPPPSSSSSYSCKAANKKRSSSEMDSTKNQEQQASPRCAPPLPKTQIVGWPPVRSYRKNTLPSNKSAPPQLPPSDASGVYVKVSMDGAPYLRKIDLNCCKNYADLLKAMEEMFGCTIGACSEGEECKHAPTYEDRDGDWMLVGDVPWDMFVASCKRLRITHERVSVRELS